MMRHWHKAKPRVATWLGHTLFSGMFLKIRPILTSSLPACKKKTSAESLIYNPDAHLWFCFVSVLPHVLFPFLVTHHQDASPSELPPSSASRQQDGEADGSRGAKHENDAGTFCRFSFSSLSLPLVWKHSRTAAASLNWLNLSSHLGSAALTGGKSEAANRHLRNMWSQQSGGWPSVSWVFLEGKRGGRVWRKWRGGKTGVMWRESVFYFLFSSEKI